MAVLYFLVLLGLTIGLWRLVANHRATQPRPRLRFTGPDDDPDFLRELDRRSRSGDEDSG